MSTVAHKPPQHYEQPACQSKVVILSGPSSCGKTALGTALTALDSTWVYVPQDLHFINEVEKEIQKRFPDQCRRISKCAGAAGIFPSLKRTEGVFSDSASKEDIADAEQARAEIESAFTPEWIAKFKKTTYCRPRELVLEDVRKQIAAGKNVLFDGYGVTRKQFEEIEPNPIVFHGLVYTPLEKSIQYVQSRNQEAKDHDLNLHRFFGAMLSSFEAMFKVCKQKTERTVAVVNYQEVKDLFTWLEEQLPEDGYKDFLFWYEMPLSYFSSLRDNLLPDTEEGLLYIEPKKEYDFVFTEEGTPQERAQILLDVLSKLGQTTAN